VTRIQQESLPDGVVGQPYSFDLDHDCEGKATWEEIGWSVSGDLPPGIEFSGAGRFSGRPTRAGAFPLTVSVHDTVLYSGRVILSMPYVLTVRPTQ
jgi:hypothetical protein